jgi:hypothetical protein
VLSLPFELRRLAAFKADVLTALARIFVEATFATYRARAKRAGVDGAQCGSVLCVQRFGSLNLNVHFHTLVLDGVFTRDPQGRVVFHPAPTPGPRELGAIVEGTCRKAIAWLRRHGYLDEGSSGEQAQNALDACAAVAMQRGHLATLARPAAADAADEDHEQAADKNEVAVEHQGFNLHAGVRIDAGDDLGRERLARYALRPPLSLERLRRLPGGRIAYRLKYVSRGRGKHRVMTPMEFMARLSAIVAPPRYPLVRYGGVLAPRSKWRGDVVPSPREREGGCVVAPRRSDWAATRTAGGARQANEGESARPSGLRSSNGGSGASRAASRSPSRCRGLARASGTPNEPRSQVDTLRTRNGDANPSQLSADQRQFRALVVADFRPLVARLVRAEAQRLAVPLTHDVAKEGETVGVIAVLFALRDFDAAGLKPFWLCALTRAREEIRSWLERGIVWRPRTAAAS